MDEMIQQAIDYFEEGKRWDKKGAYVWATVRYAQAAAILEALARGYMKGSLKLSGKAVEQIRQISLEIKARMDGVHAKLGNGRKRKNPEWSDGPELREVLEKLSRELRSAY